MMNCLQFCFNLAFNINLRRYTTGNQIEVSKINGKVAGFFQSLTGLLAAAEQRGGVPAGAYTRPH